MTFMTSENLLNLTEHQFSYLLYVGYDTTLVDYYKNDGLREV